LTALHVSETPPMSLSTLYRLRRRSTPGDSAPIADEIRELGRELGIEVEARVSAAARPEVSIVSIAEQDNYDLLIMGAVCRADDENRLHFGPKVEHILRNIRCATAVVVPSKRI